MFRRLFTPSKAQQKFTETMLEFSDTMVEILWYRIEELRIQIEFGNTSPRLQQGYEEGFARFIELRERAIANRLDAENEGLVSRCFRSLPVVCPSIWSHGGN